MSETSTSTGRDSMNSSAFRAPSTKFMSHSLRILRNWRCSPCNTRTSSSTNNSNFGPLDWATIKYADNLRYVPPANFVGQDTITFTAFDSAGNSAIGTVTVNVLPDPIGVVVPSAYSSAAGNGGVNTLVRSTNAPRTFQMQFTPAALGGLPIGARITALAFRLFTNSAADFPSTTTSWSDYEVTLAQAANPITSMSTNFLANLLNPVLVKSAVNVLPKCLSCRAQASTWATE